ncbi:MAG: hypothetical protein HY961_08895 [Ignavibacteriae bacterium]|nr:hypothetical protein [Ignavibacteriota bacterium]
MKNQFSVALLALLMVAAETSTALPRFAMRTGAKCQSCHVNPSGGGMRQAFGVQYGRETLPVPTWSEDFDFDEFSTKLSETISVGADFRTLYYYIDSPGGSSNAFFQMQGDVYLNFKLAKKINIYIDRGLSNYEIFGKLDILPANGYLKVGRFIPNYGIKVDEHRVYTREFTGFSPETGSPFFTGGEIGFSPGPISLTGGIYNSSEGRAPVISSNKAFLGRLEGIFKASESVNFWAGANVFHKNTGGVKTTMFGGFGGLSFGDFTVMMEGDFVKDKSAGDTTAVVAYVEADYVIVPGFDAKVIYDFYDPNKDFKTGAMWRLSLGFEFFPISGVEVRPMYRIIKEDPVDTKNNEFHMLVHFYL